MSRVVALLIAFVPMLAFGCAPAMHVPLKADDALKIQQTRVHALVAQDEINAVIEQSNVAAAGGGGLLLALVDVAVESHRTARAAKLMEPIRKEVSDFDFRAQLDDPLRKTVAGLTPLKVVQATVAAKPLPATDRAALWKDVPENTLLSLATTYELTGSLKSLMVTTTATYWMRDREKPIYRGRYVYYTPPLGRCQEREECAQAWAADKGAALRAAMRLGIAETMKMLAVDLGDVKPTATPTPKLAYADAPGLLSFPSYLVKDGNRYIVRLDGGVLFSGSSEASFVAETAAAR